MLSKTTALAIFTTGCCVITAQAEEPRHNISIKAGRYSLKHTQQTTSYVSEEYKGGGYLPCKTNCVSSKPVDLNIEQDSALWGSIEYEYQFGEGYSIGGEWAKFEHTYTSSLQPGWSSSISTHFFNSTLRKYFNHTANLRPYLGAGIGVATASFHGPLEGEAFGFTSNLKLGLLYQLEKIGFTTELMYITGYSVEGETGPEARKGEISGPYKLDGYAIFIGARIGL